MLAPFLFPKLIRRSTRIRLYGKKVAYNNLFNASRQAARSSDSLNKLSIAAIWMNELQVWSWTIGGQQIHSLLHFGARAIRRRSVRLVCYEMHLGAGDSRVGDRVMRYRQCSNHLRNRSKNLRNQHSDTTQHRYWIKEENYKIKRIHSRNWRIDKRATRLGWSEFGTGIGLSPRDFTLEYR